MNANELADFEEHAFDCAECAASLRDGSAFLDSGRSLVRAERRFRWRPMLTSWLPSAAAAALAVVVAVQNFVPRFAPQAPGISVLHGIQLDPSRGAAVDNVRAGETALLYLNITAEESYARYVCELRDASGHVRASQTITKEQASESVPVLLRPLPAGSYLLVVSGVREDGNRREIDKYPVNVQGP